MLLVLFVTCAAVCAETPGHYHRQCLGHQCLQFATQPAHSVLQEVPLQRDKANYLLLPTTAYQRSSRKRIRCRREYPEVRSGSPIDDAKCIASYVQVCQKIYKEHKDTCNKVAKNICNSKEGQRHQGTKKTYIYSTRKQCDPKKRSCSRQRRRVCSAWNTSLDERKKGVGQSGSYRNDVVKQNQPKVRHFDLTGPPMISSSGKKPWTPFVIDLTY